MDGELLTPDDHDALLEGRPIRILVDDIPCILVREEVFEALPGPDDVRAVYPLILKAWDSDDEDPEQYFEYLEHLKR